MNHTEQVTLGDLITLQRGFDLPMDRRVEGTVPVVASTGIAAYHDEVKVNAPGVVIGRSGSIGGGQYLSKDFWPLNTTLWIKDFKGNDPRFMYYLIRSIDFTRFNAGAGVPTLNRNHINGIRVPRFDSDEQLQIAAHLLTYDDLIENNLRRIELLEQSARLLYKEWFIRFRFPGHEGASFSNGLPVGWKSTRLVNVAELTYGYSFKSKFFNTTGDGLPLVRIRDIPAGESQTYTPEEAPKSKLLNDGDFVVGMDGDFHMNCWTGGKAWINQRVVRIKGVPGVGDTFLRYACQRPIEIFNATIVGTTVAHLGAKHLNLINVLIPDEMIFNKAQEFFDSVGSQLVILAQQIRTARRARDLLLPRLMNGTVTL
ncbi:restriction endonuclease subunit S [Dehalococcoides mccartyi]|nr:restriction endonuclease subunit S [Dehalococcoides mccartyi]